MAHSEKVCRVGAMALAKFEELDKESAAIQERHYKESEEMNARKREFTLSLRAKVDTKTEDGEKA
jgi:hypothetical protein